MAVWEWQLGRRSSLHQGRAKTFPSSCWAWETVWTLSRLFPKPNKGKRQGKADKKPSGNAKGNKAGNGFSRVPHILCFRQFTLEETIE